MVRGERGVRGEKNFLLSLSLPVSRSFSFQAIVSSGQIPAGFLDSRQYFYYQMPSFYTFNTTSTKWTVRQRGHRVIGRMYTVSPREPERYALRLLLLRTKGARSFEDLRTVEDDEGHVTVHPTFAEAAKARGFFDDDSHHIQTLREAALFQDPVQLRGVFVAALAFSEMTDPLTVWEAVKEDLAEDFRHRHGVSEEEAEALAYYDIEERLLRYDGERAGKRNTATVTLSICRNNLRMADFNIPAPRVVLPQIDVVLHDPDLCRVAGDNLYLTLNAQQKEACDVILSAADRQCPQRLFFIDGPGGSGKTYLYKALFNILIGRGMKVRWDRGERVDD